MQWIDTETLKRDHPVEEVIERYGLGLRLSGSTFVGRCPLHDDGGRPNLYVYPSTQSWFCYRCNIGGDVISFVQRVEGVEFREAVERLIGGQIVVRHALTHPVTRRTPGTKPRIAWGSDERACLTATVELYHNRLLRDSEALKYVRGRGLPDDVIERCRIGYAAGNQLTAYLHRQNLSVPAAMRIGLLRTNGREFMAGRVVVPETRDGQPIWLVGRTIDFRIDRPKYLGLPGCKPLLGWEAAKESREVFLVEGVFDWLALLSWGYPALALVGTHVRPSVLHALTAFERVYLILDNDEAGQAATEALARTLGSRAAIVRLPGVKDVAELATISEGPRIFSRTVGQPDLAQVA